MNNKLPTIGFVIPTLNSERTLEKCLDSIIEQDYPEDKIEIIIVDGGSVDNTFRIIQKYQKVKILKNILKTGEAGKSIGIKECKSEIIALIDSDNVLDGEDWLKRMVSPLVKDNSLVSSEPLYWSYRNNDSIIDKYCALTGVNDPICLFLGNYDRWSYLTGKWTAYPMQEIDKIDYLEVVINKKFVPTMGANGYLIRRDIIENIHISQYYFDCDMVWELVQNGFNKIARVKIGIIHLFSGNLKTYIRKQNRRIKDYIYFKNSFQRKYPYHILSCRFFKFILYTLFIVPLVIQSFIGYSKKRDVAWFIHPLICWITLVVYGWGFMVSFFKPSTLSRSKWRQ
jgi:glycosyltransferase involved in cell wall biosynthesis